MTHGGAWALSHELCPTWREGSAQSAGRNRHAFRSARWSTLRVLRSFVAAQKVRGEGPDLAPRPEFSQGAPPPPAAARWRRRHQDLPLQPDRQTWTLWWAPCRPLGLPWRPWGWVWHFAAPTSSLAPMARCGGAEAAASLPLHLLGTPQPAEPRLTALHAPHPLQTAAKFVAWVTLPSLILQTFNGCARRGPWARRLAAPAATRRRCHCRSGNRVPSRELLRPRCGLLPCSLSPADLPLPVLGGAALATALSAALSWCACLGGAGSRRGTASLRVCTAPTLCSSAAPACAPCS